MPLIQKEPKEIHIYIDKETQYLCFTAAATNSYIALISNGTPTAVNLETSIDGNTWTDYTIGSRITLSNIGDKIYIRNKSEVPTSFSTSNSNYYLFSITNGKVEASGDVTTLLCKYGTDTITCDYCFAHLFDSQSRLLTTPDIPATTLTSHCYNFMFYLCDKITTMPNLPATELADYCYWNMFQGCTSLEILPILPATVLPEKCYYQLFYGCSKIKISETQTGDYQTPYRIPFQGLGFVGTGALDSMFSITGGTFTGTPTANTIYYTSNTLN